MKMQINKNRNLAAIVLMTQVLFLSPVTKAAVSCLQALQGSETVAQMKMVETHQEIYQDMQKFLRFSSNLPKLVYDMGAKYNKSLRTALQSQGIKTFLQSTIWSLKNPITGQEQKITADVLMVVPGQDNEISRMAATLDKQGIHLVYAPVLVDLKEVASDQAPKDMVLLPKDLLSTAKGRVDTYHAFYKALFSGLNTSPLQNMPTRLVFVAEKGKGNFSAASLLAWGATINKLQKALESGDKMQDLQYQINLAHISVYGEARLILNYVEQLQLAMNQLPLNRFARQKSDGSIEILLLDSSVIYQAVNKPSLSFYELQNQASGKIYFKPDVITSMSNDPGAMEQQILAEIPALQSLAKASYSKDVQTGHGMLATQLQAGRMNKEIPATTPMVSSISWLMGLFF